MSWFAHNECCQQLLWPMSCVVSLQCSTTQGPHTARSVKRATRAPCAARRELRHWNGGGVAAFREYAQYQHSSAVTCSVLDDRTATSTLRSLSDLQGYCLCMMLGVEGAKFEVSSLAFGVCMAIAANAQGWRCLESWECAS